ncbi:hypothetical protein FB45DRAFT_888977 [Roridomyces roridus]|uniref:Uncharacterized protein n=1 Tax=Roridomyces roridus TaxID=1738132 RepID=A0AAD7CKB9_9AGAR|nr:hypothetical protein FB45DRAFT_888977 [Roridomyces roridus]
MESRGASGAMPSGRMPSHLCLYSSRRPPEFRFPDFSNLLQDLVAHVSPPLVLLESLRPLARNKIETMPSPYATMEIHLVCHGHGRVGRATNAAQHNLGVGNLVRLVNVCRLLPVLECHPTDKLAAREVAEDRVALEPGQFERPVYEVLENAVVDVPKEFMRELQLEDAELGLHDAEGLSLANDSSLAPWILVQRIVFVKFPLVICGEQVFRQILRGKIIADADDAVPRPRERSRRNRESVI